MIINMKKLAIICLFLSTVFTLSAQKKKYKNISGKVTYLSVALPNVNIIVNNNEQGTESDEKGNYLIKANIGDIITYSYVGFETITILIEDITSVLNIEMVVKANDLDEIVIKSTNKESEYNKSKQNFSLIFFSKILIAIFFLLIKSLYDSSRLSKACLFPLS